LLWDYPPEMEPLSRPRSDRPRLQGSPEGPVLWSVQLPAGYELLSTDAGSAQSSSALTALLHAERAAALFRLSSVLADSIDREQTARDRWAACQQQFYRSCRLAEQQRATLTEAVVGPEGQSLGDWLKDLLTRNRDQ